MSCKQSQCAFDCGHASIRHAFQSGCVQLYGDVCLQRFVGKLPEDIQSNPQQLGSLLYSCVTLAHEEERMLQEALPKSPFQVSSANLDLNNMQCWALFRQLHKMCCAYHCKYQKV